MNANAANQVNLEQKQQDLPQQKPVNGLKGLRYWREDIKAGLVVSVVSLPLSLGIAIASGAPPIAGIISSIIAGLLFPFIGGAYVTISGPAAGLAPVIMASMVSLGHGSLEKGYPLVLAVICMAGMLQIILTMLKAAKYSAMFPAAAVHGMLASIGLLLIAKQLPNFIGHAYKAHEFFGQIMETPSEIGLMNPQVFLISAVSLIAIFALSSLSPRWLRIVPPPLTVIVLGSIMAKLIKLDSSFLIHIPEQPLKHGIVLPDFIGLFSDHTLWITTIVCSLTLTLIDGFESLATIKAIDKIDPFRRTSDPNRTLLAMAFSNICSSIAGGLTIIPGGIKSTACIQAGGCTLWANFYNAIFLIIYIMVARDLINTIPLGSLAAILIFIGYKLCAPRIWRHMAEIGKEQITVFSITVFVTLLTDLLVGILAGIAVKFAIQTYLVFSIQRKFNPNKKVFPALLEAIFSLLKNPLDTRLLTNDVCVLKFKGPMVCFNACQVLEELQSIPSTCKEIKIEIDNHVPLIDHTTCSNLLSFVEEKNRAGNRTYIKGLDTMQKQAPEKTSMRLAAFTS